MIRGAGTLLDEHLDTLTDQLGVGWFDRLGFGVAEDPALGPQTIVVDPTRLLVTVGDRAAFDAARDWANLETDVRAIFTAELQRLARRCGVWTSGIPRRRVR